MKSIHLLTACFCCLLSTGQAEFANFITRKENKLHDGDKVFRFAGANMPGIILPYDFTLYLPERVHLPTPWEQEDAFKTLAQMNAGVLRFWMLPHRKPSETAPKGGKTWHYVQGPNEFNDESFRCIDQALALANQYGIRIIFSLTDSSDYWGGAQTIAAHRNKDVKEFWTDPQLRQDYKNIARHVIQRVNTITGKRYMDDKAILAWELGNELLKAPDAWLSEMAAYIKSLDAQHLVSETRHRPGTPFCIDPNIDLVTRHLYPDYPGTEKGWIPAMQKEMANLAKQRPLFIGEYGPYIDHKMFTKDNVVVKTREFLDYVHGEESISGSLLWSVYFHRQDGGFLWHQIFTYSAVWAYHWPGFPSANAQREVDVMQTVREAAFKIQGLPVPPVPTPEAPVLLPFADVPMFSWRGSVGASGYDIERAPKADGPWTQIAANVSDADAAYRPLFSDTTTHAGESWCYRVMARNPSGISKPSNVVGPVTVKRVCFVDEMQDFSRVHAKSDGLALNNDFNGLYAEYLFRAKGSKGDWITYQVPADISSLKIVAFVDPALTDNADLKLQVSNNGSVFSDLQPKRVERPLTSPPTKRPHVAGKHRTMVEYECAVPTGNRQLKIAWMGPTEIDRVEIYHP